MSTIIGVKFRDTGKVYYCDPGESALRYHDHVIVDTSRGIDYGTVVISPTEVAEDKLPADVSKMVRPATQDDDAHIKELREKEREAYRICKEKIAEHNLEMKLIEAEYTFDNSKLLFYFTADGRIDFRELVRELAGIFRIRIELRQVGVRDETKLLGGMGTCGRPLCCHTWLTDFTPVSIKMAKDQNLSLNPSKISGCCGRLMCCLKNEADTYAYLRKGMPNRGDYVTTPEGEHGDVHSVDILRQSVKVIVELDHDEKELREFNVKDITFVPKSKKPKKIPKENESAEAGKGQDARPQKRVRMARDERAERSSRSGNLTGTGDHDRVHRAGNPVVTGDHDRVSHTGNAAETGFRGRLARTETKEPAAEQEFPRQSERQGRREGSEGSAGRRSRMRGGDRAERKERMRGGEREERTDSGVRAERAERQKTGERGERTEHQKTTERAERAERPKTAERPKRRERVRGGERTDKKERTGEGGRSEDSRRRRRRKPGSSQAKDGRNDTQKG